MAAFIVISDAAGKVLASLPTSKAARYSIAAAADQRALAAFKAANPAAASATIGETHFEFSRGRAVVVLTAAQRAADAADLAARVAAQAAAGSQADFEEEFA